MAYASDRFFICSLLLCICLGFIAMIVGLLSSSRSMFHAPKVDSTRPNEYTIIPQPALVTRKMGQFKITNDTKIVVASNDEGLQLAADYLTGLLGLGNVCEENGKQDAIVFILDPSVENVEGYDLKVDFGKVIIKARTGLDNLAVIG
jgi:hypothetical protein